VGLTSPALPFLLAGLVLGLLLAIVLGWRKLARPGLRPVLLRAGSLLTLQVCVLSLIFVTVNRSGEFYSSWSDLLGSDASQGSVVASAAVRASAVRPVVVLSHEPVRTPGTRASGGTLDTVRFTGQLSGLAVTGHVYLPPGYASAGSPARYPLIVVITDHLGDASSPYSASRLAENAARLIKARRLEPVLIAMLPAALSASDQGCLNVPAEPATAGAPSRPAVQASTFYTSDLPGMLESAFRAGTSAGGRALLGDESGGYCALQLSLASSWVFPVAVAPAGPYQQPPGTGENAGSPQLALQENLPWVLRSEPMQRVWFLLTGTTPGGGQASPFLRLARPPMQVATATLDSGSWPLNGVLTWIGAAIRPGREAAWPGAPAGSRSHAGHTPDGTVR
jgi:enterochelin esterase-like enzyme